jgi:hypothetical protein
MSTDSKAFSILQGGLQYVCISPPDLPQSSAGACVEPVEVKMGASRAKAMRDGNQPGAVSEGFVDGAVHGALRD